MTAVGDHNLPEVVTIKPATTWSTLRRGLAMAAECMPVMGCMVRDHLRGSRVHPDRVGPVGPGVINTLEAEHDDR